jgi:hypothetical protein
MLSAGDYFIVMLNANVIMLSVVVLNVIMLSVVMLNVVGLLKLLGHLFLMLTCYSGFCDSGIFGYLFFSLLSLSLHLLWPG